MLISNNPIQSFFSTRKVLVVFICVAIASVAIGYLGARNALYAIGLVGIIVLAVLILAWPDITTIAVLVVLYTNAVAVAVQYHNLPFIVGAAVPLALMNPLAIYLVIRREKLIFHPMLGLLIIYLLIQIVGAIQAIKIDVAFSEVFTFVSEGLVLYFLITNVVRDSRMLRRVTWALLIGGALIGGLSGYQQVTNTFDNNYGGFAQVSNAAFGTGQELLLGEAVQPRLAGPIGEQNRYAQVMLMLVPLGLVIFWGERSKLLQITALVATGLISVGVLLTFSRGAAVGFVLMIVIMALLRYIKFYQLAIIVLGIFLLLQLVPQFGARLTSLELLSNLVSANSSTSISQADSSTQSRLTEMMSAVLVFVDHPIIGVGPGMFRYYYQDYAKLVGLRVLAATRQAHSLFPGLAAESGGLGLLCFLAILYVTLRDLSRARRGWMKSRPYLANLATGFILAIVCYITTGLFLHMGYIRFFWIIMSLAGALIYIFKNQSHASIPLGIIAQEEMKILGKTKRIKDNHSNNEVNNNIGD